ncbi:MAG: hypothetical protein EOL91_11480 [Actinobacteria bacterium]|nr:hypothetical protein [Actinomycetota bacterium]
MIINNCEQGSDEWFAVRCGVPTASNFEKIITTKGEPSKQALKYMYQLAGESVTGVKEETYQNSAMLRGVEMEAEARSFYELVNDVSVEQVGFCLHDDGFGCSPDGLVGTDGLIEIKCPSLAVSVGYLLDGGLPTDYFQQVQGQLLVTGRKWCDFISYYPGLKPLIIRVEPDKEFIEKLHNELKTFCKNLNQTITKLKD